MEPSPARDISGATADMQLDAAVGPFYTPASMAEAIGESRASIYRRITAGTVLAARLYNERWVCPTWQVVDDAVHPDLVALWRKLTESADEWTALLWLSPIRQTEVRHPGWLVERLGREQKENPA